jgi:hypothetical protein
MQIQTLPKRAQVIAASLDHLEAIHWSVALPMHLDSTANRDPRCNHFLCRFQAQFIVSCVVLQEDVRQSLYYRTIKGKVSSISVWNHLNVHHSLARNVWRLEILDERSTESETHPPGISTSKTDLQSSDNELGLHDKQEQYLISALTKMSALQSFSWSCNHSQISIDHVWPTPEVPFPEGDSDQ